MLFTEPYTRDVLNLTKSIVVYLHSESVSVNIELQNIYGTSYRFIAEDITTWKHYLNMTGEKHQIDTQLLPDGIQVYVTELMGYRDLNKQLLEDYPVTREILKRMGDEYDELLDKYPDFETLIRGIVYPVDMSVLVKAKDGDILAYNHKLVEKQEHTLIAEVQKEVKRYLLRWHIAEYTITDEYYIPSLIAGMTSSILLKINNHRMSKQGTEEIHSVLMNEFFKSHLSLQRDVEILSEDIKLWLYKNLRYIINHVGKDSTLDLLVKEVFRKSGLYVKEAVIRNRLPIEFNQTNLSKPSYSKNTDNIFYAENGDSCNITSSITNDLILFKEIDEVTYDTKTLIINDERYRRKLTNDVATPINTLERTKVITIEYENAYNVFPANVPEITLENWFHMGMVLNQNRYETFVDPNTKITYYLRETDAIKLVLKHLLILINKEELLLTNLTLSNIPNHVYSTDNLITDLPDVVETVNALLDEMVIYDGTNTEEVIDSIIKFYNLLWVYANDEDNPVIRSDIELIYERIREPVVVSLSNTPKSILEITENIPFNYTTNYDYRLSVIEMTRVFTGINIDKSMEIDNLLSKFRNIIDKLTSYTTQTLDENLYASVSAASDDIGVLRDANIMTPIDSRFYCLELLDLTVNVQADDAKDKIYVSNMNISKANLSGPLQPRMDLDIVNEELVEFKVMSNMVLLTDPDAEQHANDLPHALPHQF